MAKDKRFVKSSVRWIDWKYGTFYNIDINKEDFMKLPTNEAWYVKLTMSEFKYWPNKYWNTHYLVLNTWKPKSDDWWGIPVDEQEDDDLPF